MTNLQKLRNYVGANGNWDRFGICDFKLNDKYLVCSMGKPEVYECEFPDLTDHIEQISEARAKVLLDYFTKPRDVEFSVLT